MQVIDKAPTTLKGRGASPQEKCAALSEKVREETLTALTAVGEIKDSERDGFRSYLLRNSINVGEILPVMAQLRGVDIEQQGAAVASWGRLIAPVVKKRYSLVPFADRLLGSSAIFENYSTILEAASLVRCPLIFSEDADVLGFGIVNPVAGLHLAEFVEEFLKEQTGVRPYISKFLLGLDTWQTICSRQFEQ